MLTIINKECTVFDGEYFLEEEYSVFMLSLFQKYNIPLDTINWETEYKESLDTTIIADTTIRKKQFKESAVGDGFQREKEGIYFTHEFKTLLTDYRYRMQFENILRAYAIRQGYLEDFPHKPNIIIVDTVSKMQQFLKRAEKLSKHTKISVDLETTGFDFWRPETKIMCIGLCWDDGDTYAIPLNHTQSNFSEICGVIMHRLKPMLEGHFLIGDNFVFDALWLKQKYNIDANFQADGIQMQYFLNENEYKGLKYRAIKYCNSGQYNNEIEFGSKRPKETWEQYVDRCCSTPLEPLLRYQALDVFYSRHCYNIERVKLFNQKAVRPYLWLVKPANNLYKEIRLRGIHLDKKRMEKKLEEYNKEMEQLHNKMVSLVPETFDTKGINFNSNKQLGTLLYSEKGFNMTAVAKTPTGKPKTDTYTLKTLEEIIPKYSDFFEALKRYKHIIKMKGTYLEPWLENLDSESRFHPEFNITGTKTGRLSGNFQQLPRKGSIRNMVGGRPGYAFVELDLSQIELRIAAVIAKEENMLRIFAEDGDIHTNTAKIITGKAEVAKEDRQKAKPVNFGFIYGQSAPSFRDYAENEYGVVLTEEEAFQFRDKYFEGYPRLLEWHAEVTAFIQEHGYIDSPFGRRRNLPEVFLPNSSYYHRRLKSSAIREGINAPVQATGSDVLLFQYIRIFNTLESERPNWREWMNPVGGVHDSMYWEIKEEFAEEEARWMKSIIEDINPLKITFGWDCPIPLKADIKIGLDYGSAKEL